MEHRELGGVPTELYVRPGFPIIIKKNVEPLDGITNGAVGVIDSYAQNDEGVIDWIWVKFADEKVGRQQIADGQHIIRANLLATHDVASG